MITVTQRTQTLENTRQYIKILANTINLHETNTA